MTAGDFSKEETCCFSGYRPEKLPWGEREDDERCRELKRRIFHIAEALYISGRRRFICGMARGCDIYFAEAVLTLRDINDGVVVEAALPFTEQAEKWNAAWRERYYRLLSRCDIETYISREYTKDCMARRNRYMVDSSSVIITVFDGRFGGTQYTRGYAFRQGLEIVDIAPPD
ncbi:MAG: DUF1273 domain-containing protein [Oscillospiraceae bacterium]|jgi:uncharacterized phage-like protein YoqJ|nr:DUF1273 domain-containing protein [Oscillospiraceae bacterium]